MIRRSLDCRPDTVVLFELPDVLRALRECAFWDVYDEHCSYFTPGSLARLFRASGFEVLVVELDYDDQYILVEAVPGGGDIIRRVRVEVRLARRAEAAPRDGDGALGARLQDHRPRRDRLFSIRPCAEAWLAPAADPL
jgi:hypothetical protein